MQDEVAPETKPELESGAEKDTAKIDRRAMAGRIGRYLVYTAPALIALTTAKGSGGACSTCG